MIPKLYVARISILTVCHVKDLNWAKTHRWTPRSTATQAPAHPTVVQWCQKNGVEISKFWMIQKPYILYIKKKQKRLLQNDIRSSQLQKNLDTSEHVWKHTVQ